MTNVESMDYTHSHPSTIASLSSTAQLSPVHYTHHISFLKTVTIPTYYGISIAISRYIAMHHRCHIALHDHVVDIVFVAKPPFIIFIHVTLESLHIPVHHWRHSYRVIFCSKYRF